MNLRLILILAGTFVVITGISTLLLDGSDQVTTAPDSVRNEVVQWRLPPHLREVSGLAVADSNHLYLMTDEEGTVYQFDLYSGDVEALFEAGPPADYEGIEVLGRQLFLVTSTGFLYARHLDSAELTVFNTGLQKACEVEGLHSMGNELLILCKTVFDPQYKDGLLVFSFNPTTGTKTVFARIPPEDFANDFKKGLNPSGITTVQTTAGIQLLILAARQKRLLVLEGTGNEKFRLTDVRKLKGHRQAEGIAVFADHRVVISDEGKNEGGEITIYPSILDIGEQ